MSSVNNSSNHSEIVQRGPAPRWSKGEDRALICRGLFWDRSVDDTSENTAEWEMNRGFIGDFQPRHLLKDTLRRQSDLFEVNTLAYRRAVLEIFDQHLLDYIPGTG